MDCPNFYETIKIDERPVMNALKIRVALLDDHPIIRRSFEVMSSNETDIIVSGNFAHSHELLSFLRNNQIDVLLLDYVLNNDDLDGLSLIKLLLSHHPELKIILSTSLESIAVIRTAFLVGIKGYIGKREETSVLFNAIRTVYKGGQYIPRDIYSALSQIPIRKRDNYSSEGLDNPDNQERCIVKLAELLTPREAEVIRCFLDGMEIIEIAAKIKRSRKTISGHKQTGMKKLGLTSDLELFKYREDLFL